jgi:hypothetical protein
LPLPKRVWADVDVFDSGDELIHTDTYTLRYIGPADCLPGHGDFFMFEGKIHQGSTATPGAVSPKPEARKVQYRLYYEVNHQLFGEENAPLARVGGWARRTSRCKNSGSISMVLWCDQ